MCGACTDCSTDNRSGPAKRCWVMSPGARSSTIRRCVRPRGRGGAESLGPNDVPQCGDCQSGQILAIIALLTENKSPNDADIESALSDNLCRCATYHRIRAAAPRSRAVSRLIGEETSKLTKFHQSAAEGTGRTQTSRRHFLIGADSGLGGLMIGFRLSRFLPSQPRPIPLPVMSRSRPMER